MTNPSKPESAPVPPSIVDEEPMLRTLSSRMVGTFGYEAVEAYDGASAVERFRESPGDFACVLLDVVMPGMSGVEALSHLLVLDPDVRVVLCTGYFRDELTSNTFTSGAASTLASLTFVTPCARQLRRSPGTYESRRSSRACVPGHWRDPVELHAVHICQLAIGSRRAP